MENIRCYTRRTFKKNKHYYLKAKVNKLAENSRNENIWGSIRMLMGIKKGYVPRAYVIKKEMVQFLTDTTSILRRWKSSVFQFIKR